MENFLNILGRSVLVLIILFFSTKLLGKKQISQLSLYDYIVGITIGSVVADISLDIEKDIIAGLSCLFVYIFFSYFVSFISLKSIKLRRFFLGVPTILIERGKIIESGLKKSKIDVNELLAEARLSGYFDISGLIMLLWKPMVKLVSFPLKIISLVQERILILRKRIKELFLML